MSATTANLHAIRSAVAEATRHARAGRYDDARLALEDLEGEDVAALDLLARIHAQQGDLTAADACWARVERLDDAHAGAREGRRRIRQIWAGTRNGTARGIGIGVAVLLLVGTGAVAAQTLNQEDPPADPGVADELDRLAGELDALRSAEAAAESAPAAPAPVDPEVALQEAREALDDPRWTTAIEGAAVAVTFNTSVFPGGGTELPESSRDLLAGVAAAVEGLDGAAITVVGHTNDIPTGNGSRYEDNTELGLARALAAAEALAAAIDLPLHDISIATSGDDDPPYPNTTEADRLKNQTVTLLVTPAP
jgi:flagellar motor protein MotB